MRNGVHLWQLIGSSFYQRAEGAIPRSWHAATGIPWSEYRQPWLDRWLRLYQNETTLAAWPITPPNTAVPPTPIPNVAAHQQQGQMTVNFQLPRPPLRTDWIAQGIFYYRADWNPSGQETISQLELDAVVGRANVFGQINTNTKAGLKPGPWTIEAWVFYSKRDIPTSDPRHYQLSTTGKTTVSLPPPVP